MRTDIGTSPFEWVGDTTSLAIGTAMYDLRCESSNNLGKLTWGGASERAREQPADMAAIRAGQPVLSHLDAFSCAG